MYAFYGYGYYFLVLTAWSLFPLIHLYQPCIHLCTYLPTLTSRNCTSKQYFSTFFYVRAQHYEPLVVTFLTAPHPTRCWILSIKVWIVKSPGLSLFYLFPSRIPIFFFFDQVVESQQDKEGGLRLGVSIAGLAENVWYPFSPTLAKPSQHFAFGICNQISNFFLLLPLPSVTLASALLLGSPHPKGRTSRAMLPIPRYPIWSWSAGSSINVQS